jgi:flagellar basal body-associated protein FliL
MYAEKHNRVYIIIIIIIIIIAVVRQGLFSSGTSRGVGWQLQIYNAQKEKTSTQQRKPDVLHNSLLI